MSSNLNTLLKQQIKDAIHAIYNNQGSEKAHAYTTSDEVSKALLDILFPAEGQHNTEITGVVKVPTVQDEAKPASDSESTDSKKERKKRGPMSDEAKAAMKAKREATIAAKKAAPVPAAEPVPAPAPAPEAAPASEGEDKDKKARKPRGPMSDEAKAAMKAKREATIAAKKAAV
jgi:hypothetical protein